MRTRSGWIAVALAVLATALFAASDNKVILSETTHRVFTDDSKDTIDCIGSPLDIDLWFNSRITEMTDGSWGFHYSIHVNVFKFTATDRLGTEYSGSETWNIKYHVASSLLYPFEDTAIRNLTGISHGSGPNLHIKYRYRVTVAAQGQATVQTDILSVECIPD